MKVLIISKYATPKLYPRHFKLGEFLINKGYDVTLVASTSNRVGKSDIPQFKGLTKTIYYNNLRVIWLKGPWISNRGLTRILSWVLFELQCLFIFGRFDVVYTSSLSLLSVYNGLYRKFFFGSKWIFEVRDVWPKSAVLLGGYSERNLGIRLLKFTEKVGYKYCDELIGTMPNLKERVNNELGINRYVRFLPQGVDLKVLNENVLEIDEAFKSKYLPNDRFIVAYVGTMNANNPLDELLELIENLPKELESKYWFLFLGRGEKKEHIKTLTSHHKNVVFPRPVDKSYIPSILRRCHVGYDSISPDLATYGLSRNKWIDYLFCGLPIVCVYEGYKSILNEAECGMYIEYKNITALLRAFEYYRNLDAEKYQRVSKRATYFVQENHSYPKLAEQLMQYF